MGRKLAFFFEQQATSSGEAELVFVSRGEANNASADDDQI
jgi:hypothetical protein